MYCGGVRDFEGLRWETVYIELAVEATAIWGNSYRRGYVSSWVGQGVPVGGGGWSSYTWLWEGPRRPFVVAKLREEVGFAIDCRGRGAYRVFRMITSRFVDNSIIWDIVMARGPAPVDFYLVGMGKCVEFPTNPVNKVVVGARGVVRGTKARDYVGGVTEEEYVGEFLMRMM